MNNQPQHQPQLNTITMATILFVALAYCIYLFDTKTKIGREITELLKDKDEK